MKKETLTVERNEEGTINYRNADGELHNPHGPAVICADGYKAHYINDKLHNPNGPAITRTGGSKEYYINDQLHNPDGPAIVWTDGSKFYYIKGERLSEAQLKAWQTQQSAPLHNKTAIIDGIEYTLTVK
jgi:hypothetical protein